jgi:hypothetical protein
MFQDYISSLAAYIQFRIYINTYSIDKSHDLFIIATLGCVMDGRTLFTHKMGRIRNLFIYSFSFYFIFDGGG